MLSQKPKLKNYSQKEDKMKNRPPKAEKTPRLQPSQNDKLFTTSQAASEGNLREIEREKQMLDARITTPKDIREG